MICSEELIALMQLCPMNVVNNVKPTALKTVKMLLSNKKIDTFLAKFWLLCVKKVKIMCHCSEYPLKMAAFRIRK